MVHLAPTRHGKKKKNKVLTSDHRFMDHVSCIVTTSNVRILDARIHMQISTSKMHILLQIPQQETKLLAYIKVAGSFQLGCFVFATKTLWCRFVEGCFGPKAFKKLSKAFQCLTDPEKKMLGLLMNGPWGKGLKRGKSWGTQEEKEETPTDLGV